MKDEYPKDTLGYHYLYSKALFGENSKPSLFLLEKAKAAPNGWDERVPVPEEQVVALLMELFLEEKS